MDTHVRVLITTLRVAAVIIMVGAVTSLWQLMVRLPWHVDGALAATAALAFAYKFERHGVK